MIRGTKLFLHKSFSNSLSRLKITQDEEYGICNSVKDQQGTSDFCFCKMTTSWDPVKSDLKPTEVLLYTAQLHHRCSCHRIWEQNSSKRHGLHRLGGCETSGFSWPRCNLHVRKKLLCCSQRRTGGHSGERATSRGIPSQRGRWGDHYGDSYVLTADEKKIKHLAKWTKYQVANTWKWRLKHLQSVRRAQDSRFLRKRTFELFNYNIVFVSAAEG